jgi:hypothetical protein
MSKSAFMAVLCLALALPGLFAQDVQVMHATVPFDFWTGQKLMPSGNYSIRLHEGRIEVKEDPGGQTAAVALTFSESRNVAPETGELVFHHYGSEYFLASLWTPGSKNGLSLSRTNREKLVASRDGAAPQIASIRLR